MSEITAASQEQSAGIGEVNQAIAQMDEMTQQNAALVEQAAAAAQSMQDQAGALARSVSVFTLHPTDQHTTSSALPPPVATLAPTVNKPAARIAGTQASAAARLPSRVASAQVAVRATAPKAGTAEDWEEF